MAEWQSASGGQVPPGAFHAGKDHNGAMYCARAHHEGDLVPGKVVPANGTAYISWGGQEHAKDQYDVLVGNNYHWVGASSDNIVPSDKAIQAGNTTSGEILYIGKVSHEGVDVVGKIHPSHKVLYVPYGGQELNFAAFEILVLN